MRIVVLTVPERLYLVESIKCVIPQVEVFCDTNHEKWNYLLKVWDTLKSDSVLWLEDDVLLCNNFLTRVNEYIRYFGENNLINFFYGGSSIDYHTVHLTGSQYLWNQCVYIPKGYTLHFYNYYMNVFRNDLRYRKSSFNYDNCIAGCLRWHKLNYWLVRPCLVQHLEVESVINSKRVTNSNRRIAKYYIDNYVTTFNLNKKIYSSKPYCYIFMSPIEYLKRIVGKNNIDCIRNTVNKRDLHIIDYYKGIIRSGTLIDPPMICGKRYDGRHRVVACMELDMKLVPVLMFRE